jgi:hypothetical protein
VDEDPVAGSDAVGAHEGYAYVAAHAGDVDAGDVVGVVYDFDNLSRNSKTHVVLLSLSV